MKTSLLIFVLFSTHIFGQTDKLNFTDSTGQRQGTWQLLGSDVPEFGIEASSIAEEGQYFNNQKIGPWIRYNKTGTQAISLIIYEYAEKANQSTRVSIFSYKYHSNGQISYLPYIGKCKTKANYKRFSESGQLIELMEYDSLGNEVYSITSIDASSLSEMSYFQIPDNFSEYKESDITIPTEKKNLQQDGYYLLDYNHEKFISGKFEGGVLIEGKECVLDETYSLVSARIFNGTGYTASFKP